ncbi:MAG: adenosylmethionine decarboxylase [Mycoplasmoidaceae bacterium]|nr:MAG: adenosylmethionine decarboxylase [Mycoplasmoidaceae bacterium]
MKAKKKIKLFNFNNLTKTLNFNFYVIKYAKTKEDKEKYNKYISDRYNSTAVTDMLRTVVDKVGAKVLSISKQDYFPVGASSCILISEEEVDKSIIDPSCNLGDVFAHLDKSHICAHTYPEYSPKNNVASFRMDIQISTCGKISPLMALDFIIEEFRCGQVSDLIIIDYMVRGFTRTDDKKIYMDHNIKTISNFISRKNRLKFFMKEYADINQRTWLTKLMNNKFNIKSHMFTNDKCDLKAVEKLIKREMIDIYSSNNKFSEIKESDVWKNIEPKEK